MRALFAATMLCASLPTAHAEIASCYGNENGQNRTATGERYNPRGLTAAHKTLPFGTVVRVTNLRNGRAVIVRIDDRGPFVAGRAIDLSLGACAAIGSSGLAHVTLEIIGR
jgi:rare lipoprotein A